MTEQRASADRVSEPPIVVRVAGVPFAVLNSVRCDRSFDAAIELVERGSVLGSLATDLCDLLHAEIGLLPSGEPKSGVVGLRRALYRGRIPRAREWNDRIASALPNRVARRVRDWIILATERDGLERTFPATFTSDVVEAEGRLRESVADPMFRRALSLASPTLHDDLTSWLTRRHWSPKRRTQVQFAKYLARAATKTSPFSTFTVSGVGAWAPDGTATRPVRPAPVRGVLELDGLILDGLAGSILADPRVAGSLPLRTNPSATLYRGSVHFLGRPPAEPVVTMPVTPSIRACLTALGTGSCTADELCSTLAGDGTERGQVDRFLSGLVRIGLLERIPPVHDQSLDPLGEWARWLTVRDVDDLAALVEDVRAYVPSTVDVDSDDGHRRRQAGLVRVVNALESNGIVPHELVNGKPKALFHENAVFTEPVAWCATESWRSALRDLDLVRRWLAAVDPTAPLRVALTRYCADRFGTGSRVPFLALYRVLHEDLADPDRGVPAAEIGRLLRSSPLEPPPPLHASPLARLRELGRIRDSARSALLDGPLIEGVVRADPELLAGLAAGWPDWVRPLRSIAVYVQERNEPSRGGLVLNMLHTGHGRGHTRVAHLVEQARGARGGNGSHPVSDRSAAVVAEFGATFGTPLNRRARSAELEIDYPFSASGRPQAERVRLGDLSVVHDTRSDSLRLLSDQVGCEVIPLHLGMMADVLLPPAAKLLSLAFGSSMYTHRSVSLFESDSADERHGGLTYRPRLELGDVVLRRATWRVPVSRVPTRSQGEKDPTYYLRVVAWARAYGIPTRCFMRTKDDETPASAGNETWLARLARKPIYVDFASWHLVLGFERLLATGDVAVFEEALPEPGTGSAGYVTEFLVEVSE